MTTHWYKIVVRDAFGRVIQIHEVGRDEMIQITLEQCDLGYSCKVTKF